MGIVQEGLQRNMKSPQPWMYMHVYIYMHTYEVDGPAVATIINNKKRRRHHSNFLFELP